MRDLAWPSCWTWGRMAWPDSQLPGEEEPSGQDIPTFHRGDSSNTSQCPLHNSSQSSHHTRQPDQRYKMNWPSSTIVFCKEHMMLRQVCLQKEQRGTISLTLHSSFISAWSSRGQFAPQTEIPWWHLQDLKALQYLMELWRISFLP